MSDGGESASARAADETLQGSLGRPTAEGERDFASLPERGASIGRYLILSKVGAGTMGVVFAGYDPELDRKVALKLLRGRRDDGGASRARLQREAQTLARMSHPHVVAVHDVGVHDGQVFVAMEFIEGETLSAWLNSNDDGTPRPWRDVVRVFQDAGRGLAAAHDEGLVHRDFKPDNVMVGDGRVLVMDFGLARGGADESSARPELEVLDRVANLDSGDVNVVATRLTQTGALLGTPLYMAPEQFAAWGGQDEQRVTALSDQFGFCIALHEALYGTTPFEAGNASELAAAVLQGRVRAPPRGSGIPVWLRRVVLRGLSPRPRDRFESMTDLLHALGQADARRRRTRWALGGAVVVAVAGAAWGARQVQRSARVSACTEAGDAIDTVWNRESQEALRDGLVGTRLSFAPTVAQKVTPWIDRQARSWRENTTAACVRATIDGTWSEATFDKAQWCLEERRGELEVLIDGLAQADEKAVQRAVQAAASLSPVQTCVDETSLAATVDPPAEDVRLEVAQVRAQLSRARYLESAGRYGEGLDLVGTARLAAEAIGWGPLVAETVQCEARLLRHTGAYAESEATGSSAYMMAVRSGTWNVAATAASDLIYVVGALQGRADEGKTWGEHAAVAIARAGDPVGLREVLRATNLGIVHASLNEFEESRRHHERALEIREAALGPEHPNLAGNLTNLGSLHAVQREYEEAKRLYERALAIWRSTLGEEHPNVALALHNLGAVHHALGEYEKARAHSERALAIREQTLRPDHPAVAETLTMLGEVLAELEEYEAALRHIERALEICSKAGDHPGIVATTRLALASALWDAPPARGGDRDRARALVEQARGPHTAAVDVDKWLAEHAE